MADEREPNYIREVAPKYLGPRRRLDLIRDAAGAASFFRSVLCDNAREHVLAVFLDGEHRPIAYSIVHIGTANSSCVHPREVFQCAILAGACSLILGHNHPSETLKISSADRAVTQNIYESGKLLGIKLLDHVVFSSEKHWSFAERGELPS